MRSSFKEVLIKIKEQMEEYMMNNRTYEDKN